MLLRWALHILATFLMGARRLRMAQAYHFPKYRSAGLAQFRVPRRTPAPPIPRGAVPRYSRNHTRGGDPSNPRVDALRHVNIPGAIQRNAEWHVELRASRGSSIARGTS